jgi:uncharacterized protein (DUF1778 family)
MASIVETRKEKLDLRLTPTAKRILQTAASAARRSVSDFVLESALSRAEEALPNRQRFSLNAEQWSRVRIDAVTNPGGDGVFADNLPNPAC